MQVLHARIKPFSYWDVFDKCLPSPKLQRYDEKLAGVGD
jgi:hypothetical protein